MHIYILFGRSKFSELNHRCRLQQIILIILKRSVSKSPIISIIRLQGTVVFRSLDIIP